jgi:hypothetical protein
LEKKSTKTGNSSATNQLVASLKKRTKKILINKETVPTVNGTERRKAGRKKKKNHNKSESGDGVQTVVRQNQVIGVDDNGSNPPRLIPQQRVETQAKVAAIESSSATDIEANHSNRTEASQPVPETTSPALCAQYLNACVDLTRKLNAYKLSDDEMMMCFKYSMLRQCLGDVERAAQNIVFGKTLLTYILLIGSQIANQEIRLGVAYSIKHPNDPQTESQSTSSRQTTQSGVKGIQTASPQLFCSTFNVQSRAEDGPHYSPSFTPIRRN